MPKSCRTMRAALLAGVTSLMVLACAPSMAQDPNLVDPVGQIVLKGAADPTYDSVAKYYPPMRSPRETLGVPTHPNSIGLDYLGRLQLITDTEAGAAPLSWIVIGDAHEALAAGSVPLVRSMADGHLPIVTVSGEQHGVKFAQTAFGWSKGFAADTELYAYVRLTIAPAKGKALPPVYLQQRTISPRAFGFAPNTFHLAALAPAAGRHGEYLLRIPVSDPSHFTAVSAGDFAAAEDQTKHFWREELTKGMTLDIPEARVANAYKAWLAYSLLNIHKINGFDEPHDGSGFYQAMYGISAALYCSELDRYGLHDQAKLCLDTAIHYQNSDGLYTINSGLPDQGAFLSALAEHYQLTGDKAWLKSVAQPIIKAGNWIIHQRAISPKTGIAAGLIKFKPYCDFPEPTFDYYGDTYCCMGLERAAKALRALGMNDDAARFEKDAAEYRAAILHSMDAATFQHDGVTILPIEPETRRIIKESNYRGGDYYSLVGSSVLETEFLAPSDHRAELISDLIQNHGGLIAGVCRFNPGIDHAYSYGYLLTQLKRGDPRRFLLGFYGMLAYGMTRDTFSGVEVTNVFTGENDATLPHQYSCTMQLQMLRTMLLREDGDTLNLGEAIPRAWLADGKHVAVHHAPTRFGILSYEIASHIKSGNIEATIDPPARDAPQHLILHLRAPLGRRLKSVTVDGQPWTKFSGDAIDLSGVAKHCVVNASY